MAKRSAAGRMPRKEKELKPSEKLQLMLRMQLRGKHCYRGAGKLLDELVRDVGTGSNVTLADGRTFRINDLFARANVTFKTVAVPRYEVEEVATD